MIDWWSVVTNSFWIFGLAVLLAAFSYFYWLGGQENTPLRQQLGKPSFLRVFAIALVLVGIGLAGTSQTIWETALSVILIISSVVFFFTIRSRQV